MPRIKAKQFNSDWYNTEKFRKLNSKWHKKLEKSGFEDIEEFGGVEEERLKSHHNMRFFPMYNTGEFVDRQRYYELANQLVHDYKFKSKLDKNIWAQHSDGIPERAIAKNLKCSYTHVRTVVRNTKLSIKRDAKDILVDLKRIKK